jgi:hypothetical protein
MEIQTLKPGKCSLTLDASKIIQGIQQTDFPPDATTTFSQQLALSANETWDKPSASTPGDLTNFQIPAKPPLPTPPTQHKAARSISTHNQQKAGMLGPWHSWGRWKDPRLHLKIKPPDL